MNHYLSGYRISIFAILICCISFIASCSSEKHYKTLSFFFDGVPDPFKKDSVTINDSLMKKDTVINNAVTANSGRPGYFLHPPYQEKACDACHEPKQRGKFTMELPDLCYICHEDFNTKFKYLHGPVAAGACTECHSPHMSKIKKLLLRENQELCFYCHKQEDVLKNMVHGDIGETNCIDCHNPHGGDDKYIFQ